MSIYATNEYIISSNNSMNENKYNNEKLKKSGVKRLLRPLMKFIKRTTKRAQKQIQYCDTSYENDQNSSNESLERQIMQDIVAGSAYLVYDDQDSCEIVPVVPEQSFVPVHFARTDAGTFFWTSVSKAYEYDFASSGHCYTECQTAEQQLPAYGYDRWVQA